MHGGMAAQHRAFIVIRRINKSVNVQQTCFQKLVWRGWERVPAGLSARLPKCRRGILARYCHGLPNDPLVSAGNHRLWRLESCVLDSFALVGRAPDAD